MATYKLTDIKLKTSRLKAIVAVKNHFNLYNQPVHESVKKLDQILQNGLTVESMYEVQSLDALNTFTYHLVEILSENEKWEKEQEVKVERACQWYNTLSPKHQEYVNLLTKIRCSPANA